MSYRCHHGLISNHCQKCVAERTEAKTQERKAIAAEIVAQLVAEHRTVDDLAYSGGKDDERARIRAAVEAEYLKVKAAWGWGGDEDDIVCLSLATVLRAIDGEPT